TIFLAEYPDAVWVETADECIERLSESWDEVHLDHDLGGEVFVDYERDDSGMAVIRWLCVQPRPAPNKTRFFIHTHNLNAGCLMALQLEEMGYNVKIRPFGEAATRPVRPAPLRSLAARVIRWLRSGGDRRVAPMETPDRPGRSEDPEA